MSSAVSFRPLWRCTEPRLELIGIDRRSDGVFPTRSVAFDALSCGLGQALRRAAQQVVVAQGLIHGEEWLLTHQWIGN